MKRLVSAAAGALFCFALASPALARGDVSAAASAYSRAQKAELGGDHAQAAELYELADSIAPTPQALRSALRSRKAAGQLAQAAGHAERLLERYPDDAESKQLSEETLALAKKSLARSEVTCTPEPCLLVVDDAAEGTEAAKRHVVYLSPGEHTLRATFGDASSEPKTVSATAGGKLLLTLERVEREAPIGAPPPTGGDPLPSTPPDADRGQGGGLSPVFFASSAVITAGLGAVSIWSGVDTLNKRDEYDENRTQTGYEEGQDLERRTNILFVATGVAATLTITLAVFTDWGGKEQAKQPRLRAGVGATPQGSLFSLSGSF